MNLLRTAKINDEILDSLNSSFEARTKQRKGATAV